jgi:uridine kinase
VERSELLSHLARRIAAIRLAHPVRVAIDGIDAAGKTTLADALAKVITAEGRPVIRASLDHFQRPRTERYRQGRDSWRGYYEDAFDYPAVLESLLLPLGPGGNRIYRRTVFDYREDRALPAITEHAPDTAVLVCDGVFLLRPELDGQWDYGVFVQVSFETALQRAVARDTPVIGSAEEVERLYLTRYFPAQRHYLELAHPQQKADAIVDNENPNHPTLKFR